MGKYRGILLREDIHSELKKLAEEEDLNIQQLLRRMIRVYRVYRHKAIVEKVEMREVAKP
jgi:predicted DNA-binding ribbon-helix-helix protein